MPPPTKSPLPCRVTFTFTKPSGSSVALSITLPFTKPCAWAAMVPISSSMQQIHLCLVSIDEIIAAAKVGVFPHIPFRMAEKYGPIVASFGSIVAGGLTPFAYLCRREASERGLPPTTKPKPITNQT